MRQLINRGNKFQADKFKAMQKYELNIEKILNNDESREESSRPVKAFLTFKSQKNHKAVTEVFINEELGWYG